MTVVTLGRLSLGPPSSFITEPVGDPVGATGGSIVPAPRAPQQITMDLNTVLSGSSTLANGQTLRRQLRSMLNNGPLKMQAFLYLIYTDDMEQNGWLVPLPATLTSRDAVAWKAVGLWEAQGGTYYLAGRKRGMREARSIWMKDLRNGGFERDYLGWIVSSEFLNLPTVGLSVLPHGATQIENAVNGQLATAVAMPTGRDGGICQQVSGPPGTGNPDLAALSFERAESAMNLSDVIVYDRRGQITAPSTGPDTTWEEVYGPDYPWNWTTGGANDVPVLDNGLIRVRYDSTNTPGFRVDVWTGSAYVEQGKMVVQRIGDVTAFDDTWVAASLEEWTPDRATILCMLSRSSDPYSLERVFITVDRGMLGATFEVYPALASSGAAADVVLQWTPALNSGVADFNNSVLKIDSQGFGSWTPGIPVTAQNAGPSPGKFAGTAGTGAGTGNSGLFGAVATLGQADFSSAAPSGENAGSENWVALMRYPTAFSTTSAYQTTFVVLQAANVLFKYLGSGSGSATAYGTAQDSYQISSQNTAGYLQCQLMFAATSAQQVLEAESMTLSAGTTATADNPGSPNNASGTGNNSTVTTSTTANRAHATQATWLSALQGVYRVFARVRVAAGTGSFRAVTSATTGPTITSTGTTYHWIDLGEITADGSTLTIGAWNSGANNTFVDRIEAVLVQDRARNSAIYSGSRDAGQAGLTDSRTLGALVAR